MAFLFTRRWLLFFIVVGLLAYLAWFLGEWQFGRLQERKHSNAVISANLAAPAVPIAELMSTTRQPATNDEWRRVTIHGTWDEANTVVLKYQTREDGGMDNGIGGPGIDVVTPLLTDEGAAVIVDRGWMPSENNGSVRPVLPKAQPGQVTVTGWVRRDGQGSAAQVSDRATRAISSTQIGKLLKTKTYQGFVDLSVESPTPEKPLVRTELPDDTSNGPHFFYGLQWWFFGGLAIFGFCFLAYDETKRRRRESAASS